jgi:hypothetical protein
LESWSLLNKDNGKDLRSFLASEIALAEQLKDASTKAMTYDRVLQLSKDETWPTTIFTSALCANEVQLRGLISEDLNASPESRLPDGGAVETALYLTLRHPIINASTVSSSSPRVWSIARPVFDLGSKTMPHALSAFDWAHATTTLKNSWSEFVRSSQSPQLNPGQPILDDVSHIFGYGIFEGKYLPFWIDPTHQTVTLFDYDSAEESNGAVKTVSCLFMFWGV